MHAWGIVHTLPYKQSLNASSFDFPELNLIFAVYSTHFHGEVPDAQESHLSLGWVCACIFLQDHTSQD